MKDVMIAYNEKKTFLATMAKRTKKLTVPTSKLSKIGLNNLKEIHFLQSWFAHLEQIQMDSNLQFLRNIPSQNKADV